MSTKKLVYLDKNNIVIFPFVFNDEDPIHQRLLAATGSEHFYLEVDNNIQADFGWKYDGKNLVDPLGNTVELKNNFSKENTRKLLCIVDGEVATYMSFPMSNPRLKNLAEDMQGEITMVEVDPSTVVTPGQKYDGSIFFDPNEYQQ